MRAFCRKATSRSLELSPRLFLGADETCFGVEYMPFIVDDSDVEAVFSRELEADFSRDCNDREGPGALFSVENEPGYVEYRTPASDFGDVNTPSLEEVFFSLGLAGGVNGCCLPDLLGLPPPA